MTKPMVRALLYIKARGRAFPAWVVRAATRRALVRRGLVVYDADAGLVLTPEGKRLLRPREER